MVQDQCSFFSLSHQHSCVSCHPAAFPEVLTGIEILTSCAGFCHDQQPPFKAVCRESTRREKSAEVFLNFRAVLIQTYIKAFRHQTSLLQCLGEHFHFKPRKLNIFLCHIYKYIKAQKKEELGHKHGSLLCLGEQEGPCQCSPLTRAPRPACVLSYRARWSSALPKCIVCF